MAGSGPGRERRTTFTNAARRAQIVESAIETIADLGYARASFARIASRGGLSSTRLISYHFAEKDELIREVLSTVVARFTDYVRPRVDAESSPRAKLMTALRANLDFMRGHRNEVVTLQEIQRNYRTADGKPVMQPRAEQDLETIESWLREGQRQGQFRRFDPQAMALFVLALRNGVIQRYHVRPDLDLALLKGELITLVDLATRA
ncbi:MAG: TetR family transcriptional regulator [Candidatus Dormibacteraeota bacterium]|nr:TetR family transcriptional regulator [Candidatus Dormibacteraeota bacterium]